MHGAANLGKYALNDASWMNSIRICSFVFNTRVDERTSKERLTNPMIIDVGITNGHVPDLDETTGTMHFELDRNLRMQQRLVITIPLIRSQMYLEHSQHSPSNTE